MYKSQVQTRRSIGKEVEKVEQKDYSEIAPLYSSTSNKYRMYRYDSKPPQEDIKVS